MKATGKVKLKVIINEPISLFQGFVIFPKPFKVTVTIGSKVVQDPISKVMII